MTKHIDQSNPAALALADAIRENGPMRFDQFMAFALYDPLHGYYSSGQRIFGATGDFTTAPELTELFGRTIGQALIPVLIETGKQVFEFGAGTGKFARDILSIAGSAIDKYTIVDLSGGLRETQRKTLEEALPATTLEKVEWANELPQDLTGIVLGNELLDSIPVRRFRLKAHRIEECHLSIEDDCLTYTWQPAADDLSSLAMKLGNAHGPWPDGYTFELCPQALAWITTITSRLNGIALMFDYGKEANQYYHPSHLQGHCRAHSQHIAHDGFLERIGHQDLTCHVDFSAIYEAIIESHAALEGYCEQGKWLLALGILDETAKLLDTCNEREAMQTKQAINTLINQSEMGESFKVICWSSQYELSDCSLSQAFLAADASHRL